MIELSRGLILLAPSSTPLLSEQVAQLRGPKESGGINFGNFQFQRVNEGQARSGFKITLSISY